MCTFADILDRKIDTNLTVGECRDKLIRVYRTKTCKIQIKPWEKDSVADVKDIYTTVTMYKKDAHGENLGERQKIILQGSVDDIFRTTVNGLLPHRIVIIAAAGKGKTTAVAKMAYDWAYCVEGSEFRKLPLLFILRLREIHPDTSLGQAIIDQLLSDVHQLRKEPLEKFIRTNQHLCWVIFDGLDEFSRNIKDWAKVPGNIGNILVNKDIPGCRVLVTTRPHLEKYFDQGDLPTVYAKMEIEGFSHANSCQYIDKFFVIHRETRSKLKSYLDHNDVINELVSTPLFCLMVCYLWRGECLKDIDTQSKLFDSINMFLWHHSKGRSSKYTVDWAANVICKLGKVAFEGLLSNSNKLIFTAADFRKNPEAVEEGCELGVLSTSESTSVKDPSIKPQVKHAFIEFYHKLAQEHAASKYLSRQTGKVKLMLGLSKLDSLLRANRTEIRNFEHLLRFAAGTNNDICIRVMENILSNKLLEESEQFRIVFDCCCEAPGLEGAVSSMIRRCIKGGKIVLKSPTIYTIVGMKKMPASYKKEVKPRELVCYIYKTTGLRAYGRIICMMYRS